MSEARYNVVVSGAALDGFELEQVKAEFAKLFSLAEAKVEQIFSRGDVVIKKGVAEASAQKFIRALSKIGAAAHLRPHTPASESFPSTETDPQRPAEPSAEQADKALSGLSASRDETQPSEVQAAVAKVAEPSDGGERYPFSFHGEGFEYFRIWIVNILLTIATLGIYSAWAKVRNGQYFYGHTEVAGSRFAYLAKPLTILKGRLIAVAVFVIYMLISELFPLVGAGLALLLVVVMPWIVIRSLRFSRRMTAWRNIRFGFDGSLGQAVIAFILWPLAGILSFGLLMPLALYKQTEFIISNTRYGTAHLRLDPCLKPYYLIFLKAAGIMLVAGALMFGLSSLLPPLGVLTMLLAYLYLFVYVSVRSANLIFSNCSLRDGEFRFDCNWTDGSYFKLVLGNTLGMILTLGLFMPWAMVRIARYKAEHLQLAGSSDIDSFVAAEEEQVTALGEELGDVFDMEVGL